MPNLSADGQENANFEAKKLQPKFNCQTLIISQPRVHSKDIDALLPLQIEVLRSLVRVDYLAVEDELEALERDAPPIGVLGGNSIGNFLA